MIIAEWQPAVGHDFTQYFGEMRWCTKKGAAERSSHRG